MSGVRWPITYSPRVMEALTIAELNVEKNNASAVTTRRSTKINSTACKSDMCTDAPLHQIVDRKTKSMMDRLTERVTTSPRYLPNTNCTRLIGRAMMV